MSVSPRREQDFPKVRGDPDVVFLEVFLDCLQDFQKKKETPRCHPQGHNARGLPPAWLNQGPRRSPNLVTTFTEEGVSRARRRTNHF